MTASEPAHDDTAAAWLHYLYDPCPPDNWVTLFAVDRTTGERHTRWAKVDDIDTIAADARALTATCCTWFGVATRTERLVGKRGGAEHCQLIPALWLDVDIAGPVHHQDNLPPDIATAHDIINRAPWTPTAVVDSGHGLQAWWVLDEPAPATDIANIMGRWRATWDRLADGWHIDNVFDVPRIMRLPGTLNHKADPRPVTILEADWDNTHTLDTIAAALDDESVPAPTVERHTTWTGTEGLPGQVFNQRHTGAELLARLGFTHGHDTAEGAHWVRPGKTKREGASATVYNSDGHTTIWSDTVTSQWPALEVRRPYDPFGLYACCYHHGNFTDAAAELERLGYGTLPGADLLDLSALTPPPPADDPEPQPAKLLHIRWVDTYLTDPPPPVDPIINGLLNAGEFMVIGAERGIGKTWLGYNIASLLTTASGPLFGRMTIPATRNVLYLQGELDETQASQRWSMLHTGEDPFTPPDLPHLAESFDQVRLRAVERRNTVKVDGQVFTDTYTDASLDGTLEATIDAMGIDVVILDPWAVFYSGNENSNDQVEAVLQELRHIGMRRRVAWVIFHHFGKSSEQREPEDMWRGASRLADWAANRVTMSRYYSERQAAEAGLERREARRYARLNFLRRGEPLDDFNVHLGPDGWWQEWAAGDDDAVGIRTGLTRGDILDALGEAGQFDSLRHAAEALGVAQGTARDYLHRLVADGWINVTDGDRGSHIYRLAAE